ncbi:MAG: two-component response regulator [Gammaproteobacteria bacterium]|nr:two-component response regulator [Gammaproteobacteria bacterium]
MAKVLVIEDDAETADQIAGELIGRGFVVDRESGGLAGLERASTGDYDVITLDRLLPELDGLALVERLRQAGIKTPVLLLSALGEVEERVRGLRAGGDDYLTKPFAFAELSARVDALLRRSPEPRATLLRLGDLEVDLLAREARRGPRRLDLQPRELRLLEHLVRHHGQVVTRAMLFEQVWHYHFDPRTNLIDVHIGRLRRKVDLPGESPLIHTVRGIGFVLRAPA